VVENIDKVIDQERQAKEAEEQLKELREEAAEQQKKLEKEAEGREKLEKENARNEAKAKEAHDKLIKAQEETERAQERLRKRMEPEACPTAEQVIKAKTRFQFDENLFHFAVAGCSGSGKSSLVNALRGLHNYDEGAAETDIIECTDKIVRYHDPINKNFMWYDIPGAGTIDVPALTYFNEQGLFIFDFIIVPVDIRFNETDVAILATCKRFGIPSFIVRSKADQHIENMMKDKRISKYEARKRFVEITRRNIESNIKNANLDADKKVYIISKDVLVALIKDGEVSEDIIDETELIEDLLRSAGKRYDRNLVQDLISSALNLYWKSKKKLLERERDEDNEKKAKDEAEKKDVVSIK
jgi:GTP-binding protein EngB required for normal cell division